MTTAQQPLGTPFGPASTAEEVIAGIDLSGKTAIVTGGYSGIGTETARVFREAGARVIVPARDTGRAAEALAAAGGVEIRAMDLLDPDSIARFVGDFLAEGEPLHLLVNSAGVMATPPGRDGRGYDIQFATNHLGHFDLATRLLPALRKADGARVIAVSSRGHRRSPVVFEDIHFDRRPYDPWEAYGQSKTANILFALEFDGRFAGDGIRALSLHPGGIVDTGLSKYMSREDLLAAGAIDKDGNPIIDPSRNLKTVPQGASTTVWCATSPALDRIGGVYCENCDIAPIIGQPDGGNANPVTMGVYPYAIDPEAAKRLWSVSERMLGRS